MMDEVLTHHHQFAFPVPVTWYRFFIGYDDEQNQTTGTGIYFVGDVALIRIFYFQSSELFSSTTQQQLQLAHRHCHHLSSFWYWEIRFDWLSRLVISFLHTDQICKQNLHIYYDSVSTTKRVVHKATHTAHHEEMPRRPRSRSGMQQQHLVSICRVRPSSSQATCLAARNDNYLYRNDARRLVQIASSAIALTARRLVALGTAQSRVRTPSRNAPEAGGR
jgi:hypothetical protein